MELQKCGWFLFLFLWYLPWLVVVSSIALLRSSRNTFYRSYRLYFLGCLLFNHLLGRTWTSLSWRWLLPYLFFCRLLRGRRVPYVRILLHVVLVVWLSLLHVVKVLRRMILLVYIILIQTLVGEMLLLDSFWQVMKLKRPHSTESVLDTFRDLAGLRSRWLKQSCGLFWLFLITPIQVLNFWSIRLNVTVNWSIILNVLRLIEHKCPLINHSIKVLHFEQVNLYLHYRFVLLKQASSGSFPLFCEIRIFLVNTLVNMSNSFKYIKRLPVYDLKDSLVVGNRFNVVAEHCLFPTKVIS